jgi:hypothetical protein
MCNVEIMDGLRPWQFLPVEPGTQTLDVVIKLKTGDIARRSFDVVGWVLYNDLESNEAMVTFADEDGEQYGPVCQGAALRGFKTENGDQIEWQYSQVTPNDPESVTVSES